MKIYFLILFIYNFGSIFLYEIIYDIDFSKEYVYRNLFTEYCHFRLKIENTNNINIKLKVPKDAEVDYRIGFAFFSNYPTDEQIVSSYYSRYFITEYSKSGDASYDEYIYSFNIVIDNVNYIDILLIINTKFDYLSIKVFSEPKKIQNNLYNISYNNIYELNNTSLINNEERGFLFKLKIDNEESGIIKIKINKEAYPDREMELEIAGYIEEPITQEDFVQKYINETILNLDSKYTDEKYSTYIYLYEKIENAKYLVIAVSFKKNMKYFSISIGPRNPDEQGRKSNEKGTSQDNKNLNESTISTPLIILLVVLYTFVILFVFYFILRKCGYSRKYNLSSQIIQDFSLQPKN